MAGHGAGIDRAVEHQPILIGGDHGRRKAGLRSVDPSHFSLGEAGGVRNREADAVRIAVEALPATMTLNTAAITAQVRSIAADLLYVCGATRDEIDEALDVGP